MLTFGSIRALSLYKICIMRLISGLKAFPLDSIIMGMLYLLTSGELGRLRHLREFFPLPCDEDEVLPIFVVSFQLMRR